MRKKAIVLTVVAILIFGCLFALSACGKSGGNTPSTGGDGQKTSIPHYWDCEYSTPKSQYDINDVTLTFIFGYNHESVEQEYFNYSEPDEKGEYPPVTVYLYFSSFGNEYLIKTVDDFFSEEYLAKNHKEKITVPAELFYNEYGLIRFYFTDSQSDEINHTITNGDKTSCAFYYKKVGDTVYIGNKDFAPEYVYAYETEINNGENTHWSGFHPAAATETDNYCALITSSSREIDDTKPLEIKFYFGSTLTENRAQSVDIYAEKQGQKLLIRTVNDYASDEYNCTLRYDYYGKLKEVVYAHKEKIYIPSEWFTGEGGEIELCVYDTERKVKLTSIKLKYELVTFNFDNGHVSQSYYFK